MNPMNAIDSIVQEIIIHAPAERVFEALADPAQRVKWWGAEGKFQATHMESDLRPGGAWVMRGTGMGGKPFTIRGEYRAVERPRLIESTWLGDWTENEAPTIVRFELEEKEDGNTLVRLTHSGFATQAARDGYQGWPWLLALARAYVEGKRAS